MTTQEWTVEFKSTYADVYFFSINVTASSKATAIRRALSLAYRDAEGRRALSTLRTIDIRIAKKEQPK